MSQVTSLSPLLPTRLIHQFPLPTWLENLALRPNGQLLTTVTSSPDLHLVDPTDPSKTTLLHTFPSISGIGGITEVDHDVFYVTGGIFDLQTLTNTPRSYLLYRVDMTAYDATGKAEVSQAMALDKIAFPNGFELLSREAGTFLAADCEDGAVFRIDVRSGTHEKVIDVPEMKNPTDPKPALPVAVNGLAVREGYLYWTNSSKQLFCRVKINGDGTPSPESEVEVLHEGFVGDDFCFDAQGNAWVTTHPLNTVQVVTADGGKRVDAAGKGDSLEIGGPTACQFDRRPGFEHLLYVVTNGGLGAPVNGREVEGGKVVVVDTSGFKA